MEQPEGIERICAVIVAYHPEEHSLGTLLDAVRDQVQTVLVVDNTPGQTIPVWLKRRCDEGCVTVLQNGENLGITGAHNRGIEWAISSEHSHVLLLDQDSRPASGMVAALLAASEKLASEGAHVAAVGPAYADERASRPAPFIRLSGIRIRRIRCPDTCSRIYCEADYLITSGTLISQDALRQVGVMEDRLFIDYVDIEWGLRARSRGLKCYGVCNGRMQHTLGDKVVRFWFLRWLEVPYHSPERNYYIFRNALYLYRQSWVPLAWKANDAYRLVLKYLFYGLIPYPRRRHLAMMTLGLWHGLIGRWGRYE